jgi:uncharacterized protein (DUF2062 family)
MAERPPLLERTRLWVERNMPTRETFERIGWLRPVAHRILLPELWRFHRRSVPRGVSLGILVGVLIPVAQTVFAALFALPARANVPVAALTTFITNPLTTPPIWVAAYWVGGYLLRLDAMIGPPPNPELHAKATSWLQWLLSTAAPATALGLVVIAVVGAAIGYVVTSCGWSWWIGRKWRRRRGRSPGA